MIVKLINSCWLKWWFRKPQPIRRPVRPARKQRLHFELLEDRVVPTTGPMTFAGLEFMITSPTGSFEVNGHAVTSSDPVQVGVAPAKNGTFTPVLQLDDGVSFMSNDATGTFTTDGTVSGIAGSDILQILDMQTHTFKAPALLSSSSYYSLPTGDTNMADLAVGGGNLVVSALHIGATELDLQGTINEAHLPGVTIPVTGNSHVVVNSNGVAFGGTDPTVAGPEQFTEGGLTVVLQNLNFATDPTNGAFDITGQATVTVGGNTLNLTFGNSTTPGLVFEGGDLQSLDATVTPPKGNADTPFMFHGLSLALTSATFTFDKTTDSFGIGADATLSLSDQTVNLNLGDAGSPGIVITTNGQLASLDASVTSDLKIGGVMIHTEDLALHYVPNSDVTVTGSASFMFDGQTLELALGSTGADGTVYPGIDIDPNTGMLMSLDASISTDITIGSVEIKAEDLGIHYAVDDPDITITGSASFDLKDDNATDADAQDQMVSIMLGGTDNSGNMHDGLVINKDNGSLVSLDAAITTDITIAGLNIKADGLGVNYQSGQAGQPGQFAIYGSASFELMGNTIMLGLGTAAMPGLMLSSTGQLESLDVSLSAHIELLGITLDATDLTVQYMPATDTLAITGGVSVTTSFVTFSATLNAPGLTIVGGELQTLNVTVSGGFSLFGFSVAANGLTIDYVKSMNTLELSGGIMIQLTSSIQFAASISQGGLLINTQTGALSIDPGPNGLEFMGSVTIGDYGIKNLDIQFSNGANGVNFSASGELDLPDNIAIKLDELKIVNGQLAAIGLTVDAPVEIGDTGFFIDSISGDLENLNNISQLQVMASVTISEGPLIQLPTIPGIFTPPPQGVALIEASGSISVSASHLDLTGQVSILGGLLGQGMATIDLNWVTGIYTVSGSFSMYDGIITFGGSLTLDNQGDITLLATASVNIPDIIPFIGGTSLGNINFYLQYRPGQDWTQDYIAAWTNVNLFFTSFTFGFKIDFAGDFNLIDGNDVNAITAAAATNTPAQNQPYTYACSYTITDPNAASAQVTLNSLDFFDDGYNSGLVNDGTIAGFGDGGSGNTTFTFYNLSHSDAIVPTLSFDVYDSNGNDIGHATFDEGGNFHFAANGNPPLEPFAAEVSDGLVTLLWHGDPGTATSIQNTEYDTSNAVIQVLQNLVNGGTAVVDTYAIDPLSTPGSGGYTPASPEGALYMDNLSDPTITQRGNTYTMTYTLNHGDPDWNGMELTVTEGGTTLGTCTIDQYGAIHFTPNGTPSIAPTGGIIHDNTVQLTWSTNPGTAISVTAMYRSVDDRVINIDFANNVAPNGQGLPGQYTVQVLTYTPLLNAPTFTETTHYKPPTVTFGAFPPTPQNGVLKGQIYAASYVPGAAAGGAQGSPSDTQVSLYYTQSDNTSNGTLMETIDYGQFINNGPNTLATGGVNWPGFQSLPAGQYYVYAVINDGQNPQQYSEVIGPFTTTGPTPALTAPAFLGLTPNSSGAEQGVFSTAAGTALGVSLGYTNSISVDATVKGGTLVFPAGSLAKQFPYTYSSAAQAQSDLNGLQFVADDTFTNSTTLTITASSTINVTTIVNGVPVTKPVTYTATENIPLLTPNTHLVVSQTLSGAVTGVTLTSGGDFYNSAPTVTFTSADGIGGGATGVATILHGVVTGLTITNPGGGYDMPPIVTLSGGDPLSPATATATIATPPSDPDTQILTVTVANPGGPDGEDGTNVMLQQYLSQGLTIELFTASQGTFDKTAQLWNIGSLPISSTNAATLTLTLKADPSTYDQPLTAVADANSTLFNYSDTDATNTVAIVPLSHSVVISPTSVPTGAVNSVYSVTFTADRGGGGPYTFASTGGSLPAGLTLTKSGVLSGVPQAAGTFAFWVTTTSFQGAITTTSVQLTIANAPLAVVGTPYTLAIPFVDGGHWSVSSGTLPPGLNLAVDANFNATVTGTPTTPGIYTFAIQETRSGGQISATNNYTLFVDAPITVSPTSLPTATVNSPYMQSFTATGGSGGLFFADGGGSSALPAGLSISIDGTLSGTIAPTATPGSYNFSLLVGDASGAAIYQTYTLPVDPAIMTSPATLPAATVNSAYSQTLTATGGTGSGYTFAITAGTLPAGLTLTPAGVLSGTIPAGTVATDAAITLTTTDSSGTAVSQTLTLDVNPAIAITPTNLPDGVAGGDYAATLSATGGTGTGYTFALDSGTLPKGLTFAADGSISGTIDPTAAAGYYAVTVTATDSAGATGTATCNFFVDAAMVVPTPKLPDATVGVPYSQQFMASGGSGIYTFTVTSGTLPAGLTLSPSGVLSGTVLTSSPAGAYPFVVTATDSLGNTCTGNASLNVDAVSETWTGAASKAWSNPANWSQHLVPGAGVNVTIPNVGRLPTLDTAATVGNLTVQSGASLTLAGHALAVDGTVVNKGTIILDGNEAVSLAHGNDTTEGTWQYVGDGTGGMLTLADFGAVDYFNLTINDSNTHHDTFQTASNLTINGNLTVACGTFAPAAGFTTCGVTLSGTGVLDAPAVLNDSGNWTMTGGTFNADGGTVFLTGSGSSQLTSGGKAFFNLTHAGSGTVTVTGNALTVNGALSDAAGSGNFRSNGFAVTVAGATTLNGGAFTAGAAAIHFNGGLTVSGGSFIGMSGAVTAAGVVETAGSMTAPTATLTDSANWSFTGGTFNANHGTVLLSGTNQHIIGSTTFFNLTKTVTAADTLTFQAGSTQTIGGTLTLKGASATKLLSLRSSTPGSTWNIFPMGTTAVSFVDVADSVNGGKKTITATGSHNSGDDTGWKFA